MYTPEDQLTPIYTDELAERRFTGALWRSAVVAVLVVGILASLALTASYRLSEQRAWDEELVFTALASDLTPSRAQAMIEASGRRAILVDQAGEATVLVPAGAPDVGGTAQSGDREAGTADPAADRWAGPITAAMLPGERQFTTEVSDGQRWWHTAVAVDDDRTLVVSRPASAATAAWREQALVILALSAATLAGLAILAVVGFRTIGRPARLLAEAGVQLRLRGRISDNLRSDLKTIGSTPVELRELADNFEEFESDLVQSDHRVNALLNAGISLSGSLDQQTVLDRTLEHLEHLLEIERTAILRYDPRIETFEVVASRGHDDAFLVDLGRRSDDPTLPSVRALRERVPVQIPDTESEVVARSLRDRARRHGYRSLLAIPLTEELEQQTVLLLHSARTRTWSFDEVELSKSFASIAGAALRNAELFESTDARLRTESSRLEAIVGSVDQGILVESDGRLLFTNGILRSLVPAGQPIHDGMLTTDLVDAILTGAERTATTREELDRLIPGEGHLDITLQTRRRATPEGIGQVNPTTEEGPTTFRVRSFAVRNTRGVQVGRGQTWRDVSRERELERMKAGLLAAVSHEFRTPLGLIKGYASTLLADDVSWNPTDQREFLQLVSSEADRLADLVKRILDMRRIDAGMVNLQPMPVRLDTVIENTLDALPHERHRVTIGPVPRLIVDIDATRVVTALRNLVENACRYSSTDSPIEVWATADSEIGRSSGDRRGSVGPQENTSDMVTVRVRDRGPGIPVRARDQIFETFVRADPGLDAPQGGLGLGLAIAKGFVEAHGGRLWIEDPADGEPGTVFALTLPISQPAEQSPTARLGVAP